MSLWHCTMWETAQKGISSLRSIFALWNLNMLLHNISGELFSSVCACCGAGGAGEQTFLVHTKLQLNWRWYGWHPPQAQVQQPVASAVSGNLKDLFPPKIHLLFPVSYISAWSQRAQGSTAATTTTTLLNCQPFTQGQQHCLGSPSTPLERWSHL